MPQFNRQRLLNRFLRYVKIGTPANQNSESYPSSSEQLVLGKLLCDELIEMGVSDVRQDEHGLVWGTIPSNSSNASPVVMLNSHLDTSPEAPAIHVRPQVIESYSGGDIVLGDSGQVVTAEHCPALAELVGKTLITTDGTTLLGGDDKAGVAVIMEVAQHLLENPQLPHGELRLLFTCDEEIGNGTQHVDLAKANATVAYTLDGGGAGEIDHETFSADLAIVKFVGKNIHPAIAKDRMVNALRAASEFVTMLPRDHLSPESTDDRSGFMHPYDLKAGVGEATLQILLRDFDSAQLEKYAEMLRLTARLVETTFVGLSVELTIKRQYRNMADFLAKMPLAVELAERAFEQLGRPCRRTIVRGGTDGSQLSERGLPTPNLSCGQHNIHSVLEFACLDEMIESAEHVVVLLDLWQQQPVASAS